MEEKKDIQDSKVKRLSRNYLNPGSPSPVINSGHNKEGSGLSINTSFSNNSHSRDVSYTSSFKSQPILENSSRSNITMDTHTNEILIKMNAKIEQIENNQSRLYNFMNDLYKKLVIYIRIKKTIIILNIYIYIFLCTKIYIFIFIYFFFSFIIIYKIK